jgi:ABC-type glutathione transport system ATPase component
MNACMTTERETLVEVRRLTRSFVERSPLTRRRFEVRALDGIDLAIRCGGALVIVGESGAGKSTLARCLALLEMPTSGQIWCEGRDLLSLSKADLRAAHAEIQLIFQDPASALNPRMTAVEIVAEPLEIQRVGSARARRQRALEWMERLRLPAAAGGKRPLELSGGQRQRLAIARALVLEPKLLILDEALSNLDLANQQMILSLLADLQAKHGLTCVHVCHDLRLASQLADEVAVMHAGKIVEQRLAVELFAAPQHNHTKELLAAMPPIEAILAERSA